jgi:hypothetical protein
LPVIPALGRQRQEDHKFKISLGYIDSQKKLRTGMQFSGRALAQHAQSFQFNPQHCKKETKQQKRKKSWPCKKVYMENCNLGSF